MDVQLTSKLETFEGDNQTIEQQVFTASCPECGSNKARIISRLHFHNGIPNDGRFVTIDCPNCQYHEWYMTGPDI